MKKLLLALAIMALICSPAMAARNANGAMVMHTDNALAFSLGSTYCGTAIPTTCDALNTTATRVDANVVWLIGAWLPTASPGVAGAQFGVNYSAEVVADFEAWGACGPGVLEIPDAGWPDGGAPVGTAIAFTAPVYPANNLLTLYWFAIDYVADGMWIESRTYPRTDTAEFADDGNPPQIDLCFNFGRVAWNVAGFNHCPTVPVETGACCFPDGTCQVLNPTECTGVYQGADTVCNPNPCPQPEACCFADGSCQFVLVPECVTLGGTPQGPGTNCSPNLCEPPPVPEACCFPDGSCQMLLAADCTGQGGAPQGADTTCETVACPTPEACCFPDGHCEMLLADVCSGQGGQPQGAGTICDNVVCPPVPTQPSTWGQIKANYR